MVQEGQDFLWPGGLGGNKEVTVEEVVSEDTVKLSEPVSGDDLVFRKDREYSVDELRQNLDPREIQQQRSPEARAADSGQDAPLTSDPLEWASDPNGKDFPGVDTGPTFREQEGEDFDTDSFIESLF